MKIFTKLIVLFILTSCSISKNIELTGTYQETGWGPMSEKYIFMEDNTFYRFYYDDTHGAFGQGTYKLTGNKLSLDYDSLLLDTPVIKKKEFSKTDSLKLNLTIMTVGSSETIKIFSCKKLISKSVLKNHSISARLERPIEKIKVQVVDNLIFKEVLKYEFELNVDSLSYCQVEYYPSNSWYAFNTVNDTVYKLKNLSEYYFEIHSGQYKWIFEKETK